MAHRLLTFFQSGTVQEIIPEGYTHTFLIRHPLKYIGSLYKAFEGFENDVQGKDMGNLWKIVTYTMISIVQDEVKMFLIEEDKKKIKIKSM